MVSRRVFVLGACAWLAAGCGLGASGGSAESRAAGAGTIAAPAATSVAAPSPRPSLPGGVLRVGTSGDYAPFSIEEPDGSFTGFDVEVVRAYAAERGRDVEIARFRWPELEARLGAGDFDVAAGGITVRGDRLVRAPMTAATARAAAVLVVAAGRPAIDVARGGEGLVVAVNRGGHLERVARRALPRATLRTVDDNRSLPRVLAAGDVDAIVTDTAELASFGLADAPVVAMLARDRKAYWVRPGDPQLAADLDAWLAAREADGTLDALRSRWGVVAPTGTAGAPSAPPATPSAPPATRAATLSAPATAAADLAGRRLLLMPLVAEAKRASGAAIEDRAREDAVVAASRSAACAAGLDPDSYAALARAQIDAAKAVQRAVLAAPPGSGGPALDLGRDLRPAIDRNDAALRAVLARGAPLDAPAGALTAALRADADVPGLRDADVEAVAAALAAVRPAAPGSCPLPRSERGASMRAQG